MVTVLPQRRRPGVPKHPSAGGPAALGVKHPEAEATPVHGGRQLPHHDRVLRIGRVMPRPGLSSPLGRPLPPGLGSPSYAAWLGLVCSSAVPRNVAGEAAGPARLSVSQLVKQNMTLLPLDSGFGSVSFPLLFSH